MGVGPRRLAAWGAPLEFLFWFNIPKRQSGSRRTLLCCRSDGGGGGWACTSPAWLACPPFGKSLGHAILGAGKGAGGAWCRAGSLVGPLPNHNSPHAV